MSQNEKNLVQKQDHKQGGKKRSQKQENVGTEREKAVTCTNEENRMQKGETRLRSKTRKMGYNKRKSGYRKRSKSESAVTEKHETPIGVCVRVLRTAKRRYTKLRRVNHQRKKKKLLRKMNRQLQKNAKCELGVRK